MKDLKDKLLCEKCDEIHNAVFEAIKAIAHGDVEWDMSIIGEITDLIEGILVAHNINTCYPFEDENGILCCEDKGGCKYCAISVDQNQK